MHEEENTDTQYMFDAYCKTIIKNHARDIWKERKIKRKRMVFFSEMSGVEMECLAVRHAGIESAELFVVENYKVEIKNDDLAEAVEHLDDVMRDIILLYFFVGFRDIEISKLLNMPRSTVQNYRTKAMHILKLRLGGK